MIGASTHVANIGVSLCVCEAVLDPLPHHFRHQRMQAEWRRDEIGHSRVIAGSRGCQPRDIVVPVPAGRQEIREHNNLRGPTLDASIKRRLDRRLGQLHVRRLDDRKPAGSLKIFDDCKQHRVAFVSPRAVVDENDADVGAVEVYIDRSKRLSHDQTVVVPLLWPLHIGARSDGNRRAARQRKSLQYGVNIVERDAVEGVQII